jgi:hypothetical protein
MRHIQRTIIAFVPGTQQKIESTLAHEIRCLVNGDLGTLSWRQPPAPLSRRVKVRRLFISGIRTVAVAVIPFGAVIASRPLLHVNSAVFNWAWIGSAAWALLCLLLSIDPALREKINTARDLAQLAQGFAAPSDRDVEQKYRR